MMLARPLRRQRGISVVPMIDVLFILLIFFMVTSTYLDLNMVPLVQTEEDRPQITTTEPPAIQSANLLLIRLQADGLASMRGQAMRASELTENLRSIQQSRPVSEVVILPSPRADLQSLITLTQAISAGGVENARVIRLDPNP